MQWSFPDGPGWTGEAEHGGVRHGAWPSIWAACCLGVMVIGVRGQAPQALSECEALCAGLADAIRAAPEMLVMRIEDALVFNEQCAPEIVTTAIDVVGGQPELVKQIVETAVKVAPRQSDRIVQAARNFSVPAASVATAPPVEVRQAVVPTLIIDGMEVEVKRAEAPVMIGNIPLEEVRRAEMPLRALTVDEAAALPFPEVSLLPAADMTSWPSEEFALPAALMPLEPGGEPPLPDAPRALLLTEHTPPQADRLALLPGEEVRRAEPHWK